MLTILKEIYLNYGLQSIITIFICIAILSIFYKFLNNKISGKIQSNYLKEIESLKTNFQKEIDALRNKFQEDLEKFKKQIEFIYRDESLRKDSSLLIINKANKIRIILYKKIYELYFKVNLTPMKTLRDELKKIRIQIFTNSFFLDALTKHLLYIQIYLDDLLSYKLEPKLNDEQRQRMQELYVKLDEDLLESEKWIRKHLKTNKTICDYDISEQSNEDIKQLREKFLADFKQNQN